VLKVSCVVAQNFRPHTTINTQLIAVNVAVAIVVVVIKLA